MDECQRPPSARAPHGAGLPHGAGPEARTLALALAVSLALHALVLVLLDPAFRGVLAQVDRTISVIEARLVPREPALVDTPPAPAQAPAAPAEPPPAPPPVLKDTLAPKPPSDERPTPKPAPPPRAKAQPAPRPPPEPLAPQELGETYQRLAETLLYPEEAVRRGLEGETVLLLEVGADGRIVEASVASSSGHAILDAAALRAVRLLGALGPASAGKAVLLPVRFQLE